MPRRPPIAASQPSVLLIGAEALPFSKTGGLADVLGALPPALARLGWRVTLVVPRYRGVTAGTAIDGFATNVGGYTTNVKFYEAPLADGARALLLDVPELFDREGLYHVNNVDYPDNPRRFAVLVRAALEFVIRTGERPTVVHAHDWHAGLAPVYLKTLYANAPVIGSGGSGGSAGAGGAPGLTPSVFTIHNLAYQGNVPVDWLPRLDLAWDLLSMDRLEYWGQISLLKGGINYADKITTVSPTYAREIQTADGGFGFEGILRRRHDDVVGILNGIDVGEWNPEADRCLPASFSATDLSGKRRAKVEVLAKYGLPTDEAALARPLIGMISRMVDQKGLDLIAAAAERLPALQTSIVVLGTGEARYQDMWRTLAARHPDRIGAVIGFDEPLAHLIEGGADLFLMPSQWEPCGLNQMYSLRYGTVPVVRGVGGLADTVSEGETGFVFHDYTPAALLETLRRALGVYRNPAEWRRIQLNGMKQNYSWDRSAQEYVKIYERLAGGVPDVGRAFQAPPGGGPKRAAPQANRSTKRTSRQK